MEIVEGKGTIFGINVGHPIVTNGNSVALLFSAMRGGDAALPKIIWDFLFISSLITAPRLAYLSFYQNATDKIVTDEFLPTTLVVRV